MDWFSLVIVGFVVGYIWHMHETSPERQAKKDAAWKQYVEAHKEQWDREAEYERNLRDRAGG